MLGPLEVLDEGRPLDLGAPRQRALFAFLLLHANEVVSIDRLSEALWPEEIPRTAPKAIQVYVSALRKALGSARDVLETRGSGYVLRVAPGELDLHEFERLLASAWGEDARARAATLREALALWRGAPLADFEYESFVQPEAARLGELRQHAIQGRIEAELDLGGGPELVAELQSLVGAHRLQERPRVLLMRALYRAGRQSEALDVYREGKRLLDEELGLDPGPELRELERAILQQDPALSDTRKGMEPFRSIVVVPESAVGLDLLLPLAEALARIPTRRELVLGRIVPAEELSSATTALDDARRGLVERGATVRVAAFSSSSPAEDVVRLGAKQDADLLLLSSDGDPLDGALAPVFEQATSDLAVLIERGGGLAAGAIVVPFGAFEHDWAALEIGAWAAAALERPLRLIGAMDQGVRGRDASRLLADASLIVQHTTGVLAEPLLGPPGREGVAGLAEGGGLLVLGLSERWRTEGLGDMRRGLVELPRAPTVLVRRGLRPSGIAPQATLTRFTWSIEGSRI
ncbi:MAG: transcriptional regulator, family [Gaiellaceae bacterium]|nr:transcriptional regulator, family [Gaiellaceae bacterium]